MMPGEKYSSTHRFLAERVKRAAARAALRPLCRWRARPAPSREGYSILIGCPASMLSVLSTNLLFLERQQRDHLDEIIVTIDTTPARADREQIDRIRQRFQNLPLRFLFYTATQRAVLRAIQWGWCYAWLNWSLGLASAESRYCLLHDLDAMLLDEHVIEQRYERMRREQAQYLGVRYYYGNGIVPDDRLAVTFELMLDTGYVRRHFHPIDLFNHVAVHRGRRVEFDTFLYAQSRGGRVAIHPLTGEAMVHPSQLFCQYAELMRDSPYHAPRENTLPFLPYLSYVSGDVQGLERQRRCFAAADGKRVRFLGREMDISRMTSTHLQWLVTQAERVERSIVGYVRPEVQAYFQQIHQLIDRPGPNGQRDHEP